jgi:hypothetical protein
LTFYPEQAEKREVNEIKIGKEEVKLSLFVDGVSMLRNS